MADNKDLFAPPTPEEEKMFAAPTAKELGVATPVESSFFGALGRGAANMGMGVLPITEGVAGAAGSTLATSPTARSFLPAPIKALLDVASPIPDEIHSPIPEVEAKLQAQAKPNELNLQNLLNKYRQSRDETKRQLAADEEQHPIAAFTGNLAGGLALGSGLAKAGMLPEVAKDAGFGAKLGQAAEIGGTYGAAAGLGNSNADLTQGEIGQAALDTMKGGGAGALIGMGGQLAGSTLGKGWDVLKNSKYGEKLGLLKQLGKEGKDILDKNLPEQMTGELTGQAQGLQDKISGIISKLGEQKAEILQGLTDKKATVDFEPIINSALEKAEDLRGLVPDNEVDGLKKFLMKQIYKDLPEETKDKFISQVTQRFKIDPKTGESSLAGITKSIKGKGVGVEDLGGLEQTAETAPKSAGQVVTSDEEGMPKSVSQTAVESAPEITQGTKLPPMTPNEAAERVRLLQEKAFKNVPTTISDQEKTALLKDVARQASDTVENLAPEELGPRNQKLSSLIETTSKDLGEPEFRRFLEEKQVSPAVMKMIENIAVPFKPGDQRTFQNIIEHLKPVIGEEEAGKIQAALTDFSKKYNVIKEFTSETAKGTIYQQVHRVLNIPGIVANLYGRKSQDLMQFANNLSTKYGTAEAQKLSGMLQSVANSPITSRSAMLFAITQNPQYRQMIAGSQTEDTPSTSIPGVAER